MVSSKERLRIERWANKLLERLDRQKEALDRMSLAMTEATAALIEIRETDEWEDGGPRDRAKEALDYMAALTEAAARARSQAESISVQNPKESEEPSGT
jgi:hypothetical protein